jgi:O-antigen/teichoic acid export membrane protein
MTAKSISASSSGRAIAASIGKNTSFGVAGSILHVATRIVVVPVFIKHLGLDGFGIWSVLMTIAAYMSLGGAGVKSAFQKYVAESTGNGDYERASKLLSTGTAAVLVISAVLLVPIVGLSNLVATLVGVPKTFLAQASHAIIFLSLTAIVANASQTYQSIIMGAHRIDLREKINFVIEPLNALATLVLLSLGFGLTAMAVVFCAYQLAGGILWYLFARRVLPEIHIAPRYISSSVGKELIRFAVSYQMVSMLELLYAAILPIVILRFFGANAAGVFALAGRLVGTATLIQGSYLQAILSGGSLVYASGSTERMHAFIVRSFKAMSVISIMPLAFIALYGANIVLVWTGKSPQLLTGAICLLCVGGVCRSLSSLFRVLYRVSGGALLDNAQLFLTIATAVVILPFVPKLGFFGVIAGVGVLGQFFGLVLIAASFTTRFQGFNPRVLAPDLIRFSIATAVILGASVAAAYITVPWEMSARLLETLRLVTASLICLLVAMPALLLTGSISRSEARTLLSAVGVGRKHLSVA